MIDKRQLIVIRVLKAEVDIRAATFAQAFDRVIRLYEAWGRPEKAAEWRTKLTKTGVAKPKP